MQRELSRFGPAEGMTEIVRAWPEAVGEQIARNAWPARLSRDGKLHVATSSSAWAFELAQLEPKLLERLSEPLGDHVPGGLRFAPGKLPEPPTGGGPTSPRSIGKPTQSDLDTAAELAASDRRRKSSQNRCEGGSGEPLERPLTAAPSDTLRLARKGEICRAFFNG